MQRGIKVTEVSGFGTTRSRGGIFGRAPGASEYLCHPYKESNYHAKDIQLACRIRGDF